MITIKSTIPPETSAFMLEHGKAVASGSVRPSVWEKMIDLERRLIAMRNAVEWAVEVGQVIGGSRVAIVEALKDTAPKQSPENAKG